MLGGAYLPMSIFIPTGENPDFPKMLQFFKLLTIVPRVQTILYTNTFKPCVSQNTIPFPDVGENSNNIFDFNLCQPLSTISKHAAFDEPCKYFPRRRGKKCIISVTIGLDFGLTSMICPLCSYGQCFHERKARFEEDCCVQVL